MFKTDTPEFRHHFGIGQDEKASDAMVLYVAPAVPRLALFFVELKGGDHGTAAKQLKRVIRAVKEKLPPNLGRDFLAEGELFPVIVSDRASPRDQKRAEEDFSRDTGLALRTVTKGSVDLRYLLEQPSKRRR